MIDVLQVSMPASHGYRASGARPLRWIAERRTGQHVQNPAKERRIIAADRGPLGRPKTNSGASEQSGPWLTVVAAHVE
jgi:hypothetical protein